MKKKYAVIFLAIMICLSFSLSVYATSKGIISVENKSASKGDTVEIEIVMESNPGFLDMKLSVAYGEGLELISIQDTGLISGAQHSSNYHLNPYPLTWTNSLLTENLTVAGTIAKLRFYVKENATNENCKVSISYERYNIIDTDLNMVDFNLQDGGIIVAAVCDHHWNTGIVTVPPTETAMGVRQYNCLLCGASKTEMIPAILGTTTSMLEHTTETTEQIHSNTWMTTETTDVLTETTNSITGIVTETTTANMSVTESFSTRETTSMETIPIFTDQTQKPSVEEKPSKFVHWIVLIIGVVSIAVLLGIQYLNSKWKNS